MFRNEKLSVIRLTVTFRNAGQKQTEFACRPYQDEMIKACIERNTIVYLPTGAGKTYIAIMVLKHFAKDLEKPMSEGRKWSVFLTDSKVLAKQQAAVIKKSTQLKVALYTGDTNMNEWQENKWSDEFEQCQVITATVEIVLNVIRHGYLKISDINLIIFDECHHAQKEHPMAILMKRFEDIPDKKLPRIIGLTGMLTAPSIEPDDVLEDLERLQRTLRGTITTARGAAFNDVLMYSTCPVEKPIKYKKMDLNEFQQLIIRKVQSMIELIDEWPLDMENGASPDNVNNDNQKKLQKKYKKICSGFCERANDLGLYGGSLANLAAIVDMEMIKQEANTCEKALVRALITSFEEISHILMNKIDRQNHIQNESSAFLEYEPETILTNSSQHVQNLLICLQEFVDKNIDQPMKGLVFVQKRSTARILCQVVRRYFNAFPELNVNVDFMVGQNASGLGTVETMIGSKNNNKVLEKFKNGENNLIIATKVLEEGIDLQECNLVICYDKPENFRSYVQGKGRARMTQSLYVIMTEVDEYGDLQKKVDEWRKVKSILKDHLIDKAIERSSEHSDIKGDIKEKYNEEFKTMEGATVDYNSAILYLNRYCESLPKDKFTDVAPDWSDTKDENGFYCVSLLLPIQSPLKYKITGETLPSLKQAKRSVAFKTIMELYNIGELSEDLHPIDKENCLDLHKDIYFMSWNQFENDKPKEAGTRKNLRMHDIKIPDAFVNSMPQVNTLLYLYEIKMSPVSATFDKNDVNIRVFHDLLQSSRSYGILTTKPLPRMALMKFGQSFGQIECTISYEPLHIKLSDSEKLDELKRFHCVLFRNILDNWKEFFVYDLKDSVVIVPTKNHQIDWNIVEQFQIWSEWEPKTVAERMNVKHKIDDWLYSVVCPWYRKNPCEIKKYVVTHMQPGLTPNSKFPNKQYRSYADYILKNYKNIERIVYPNEFMLGVKTTANDLKCLTLNDEQKTSRNFKEDLIPELCHNFRYPGELWLKATFLPSIFHRITYILHAEFLRVTINNYVGLQIVDYTPMPLYEKMATYKPEQSTNTILKDPPDENQAKSLEASNISRFDADTALLGPKMTELIDLERHFDSVHAIDIQYVYKTICEFKALNENHSSQSVSTQLNANVPALCDVENDEKMHIKILDIKLTSPNTRGVEQHELLAAITTIASHDVFHMELFEVLGDAFLKFSVSMYLIQNHQEWHEGSLTTMKSQIVGNRNLCYSAIRHNLPGMIKIHDFNPKHDWQPPMLKVDDQVQEFMKALNINPELLGELKVSKAELESGEVFGNNLADYIQRFMDDAGGEESLMQNFLGKQRVSDKTCADCIEAILGTCVKSIGIERTFKVLEMLGISPCNGMDITEILHARLRPPRIRDDISDEDVDEFLVNHKELEKNIGYTFNDRAYLLQALTHPSYPTNRVTGCYQQLEFLGDAVLDFLITAYIFERCPHIDPGQLTDLRSALVNNVTLACLCVRYNIHGHILYQSSSLTTAISGFVDIQHKFNHVVGDHVVQLMEEEDMGKYVDVPKALGDVFEAIIGGIFIDSGNDLKATWKVIYCLMNKELDQFMHDTPLQVIRQLYEFPCAEPKFDENVVVDKDGNFEVTVRFTCKNERLSVFGYGKNKRNAERAAAKVALTKLKA